MNEVLSRYVDNPAALRHLEEGLYSALSRGDEGAPYDSKAEYYDRMVASNTYLKVAWGIRRQNFIDFMRQAFNNGDGALVDLAAGSCVDSYELYAQTKRTTFVVDLSLAMLRKGRERVIEKLGSVPKNIIFLQANALNLPLKNQTISTLLCHGGFHLLPGLDGVMAEWRRILKPNSGMFVSSLVKDRFIGGLYLNLLHKSGEVNSPSTSSEVCARLEQGTNRNFDLATQGNFAFCRSLTIFRPSTVLESNPNR